MCCCNVCVTSSVLCGSHLLSLVVLAQHARPNTGALVHTARRGGRGRPARTRVSKTQIPFAKVGWPEFRAKGRLLVSYLILWSSRYYPIIIMVQSRHKAVVKNIRTGLKGYSTLSGPRAGGRSLRAGGRSLRHRRRESSARARAKGAARGGAGRGVGRPRGRGLDRKRS